MRATGLLLAAVIALSLAAGCGEKRKPTGWRAQIVEWASGRPGEAAVPGLTSAAVHFGQLSSGPAVVIWSDQGGRFQAGWDREHEAVLYQGQYEALDGRRFQVSCLTPDGRRGTVTIDGQTFQLKHGALFLVATSGRPATVKQLPATALQPKTDFLKDLARKDPVIRDFFAGTRRTP